MEGVELKAWREGAGLTLDAGADRLGVGRRSLIRYEKGEAAIPDSVLERIRQPAPPIDQARAELKVAETGVPRSTFDPVRAGLKRLPTSNTLWGASINFDTRPPAKGWKRIAGCIRIVRESIPDPIPYEAPSWAGWRGVVTADGRVFDYESGHEMHDFSARPMTPVAARPKAGARLKAVKGGRQGR